MRPVGDLTSSPGAGNLAPEWKGRTPPYGLSRRACATSTTRRARPEPIANVPSRLSPAGAATSVPASRRNAVARLLTDARPAVVDAPDAPERRGIRERIAVHEHDIGGTAQFIAKERDVNCYSSQ